MPVFDGNLESVLGRLIESKLIERYSSLIGIVSRFDPGPPAVCDVTLPVSMLVPREGEPEASEPDELPLVPNVQIWYPRGGPVVLSWPLAVGDAVLLLINTLDPRAWRRTGQPGPPLDPALAHPAHAWAIPGVVPDKLAPPLASTTAFAITAPTTLVIGNSVRLGISGEDDTHDRYVALAEKVESELGSLADAIRGAAAPPGGGALTGFSYTAGSTASTKVKAR